MKLFTKQGFLTERGKHIFSLFLDKEVTSLLNSEKDEADIRMLGCVLSKRVGDLVSKRLLDIKKK